VCRHLGLSFSYKIASDLDLKLPTSLDPGGWAPAICAALGATCYLNPIGGQTLFDPMRFEAAGVDLKFLQAKPFTYKAGHTACEPNLSIIDVLMWNSPESLRAAINDYKLMPPNGGITTRGS
jgi:hypothetical protein